MSTQHEIQNVRDAVAERVVEITNFSNDVWGNREQSSQFLLTPHPSLGGETPLRAAMTESGIMSVKRILGAILHGLPA